MTTVRWQTNILHIICRISSHLFPLQLVLTSLYRSIFRRCTLKTIIPNVSSKACQASDRWSVHCNSREPACHQHIFCSHSPSKSAVLLFQISDVAAATGAAVRCPHIRFSRTAEHTVASVCLLPFSSCVLLLFPSLWSNFYCIYHEGKAAVVAATWYTWRHVTVDCSVNLLHKFLYLDACPLVMKSGPYCVQL